MNIDFITKRAQLLNKMAAIQTMELGSLLSEMRENSSGQPAGPYFKYQVWQDGRNISRRVPSEQAPSLQEAINNRQRFESLAKEFVDLTVAHTREMKPDAGSKKKDPTPEFVFAQDREAQQVISRFLEGLPNGNTVQQLEPALREILYKSGSLMMSVLLQQAVDQVDGSYQPKAGQQLKARVKTTVHCIFGTLVLFRDYYYNPDKGQGYYPADEALGLENGNTPALARLVCLEGADESSYHQAENHLLETGGIRFSARQIQRLVQRVGSDAQKWQLREAQKPDPDAKVVPILYISGDAKGVPMCKAELKGVKGKQPDGNAKKRSPYLGCVFTQHKADEKGRPMRDNDSTTYVSCFESIDTFGPQLRQEAIRRGMALALQVVMLIDGAVTLAKMGKDCFSSAIQIVDFYHALEHAGEVLQALLGSKEHPDYERQRSRWARQLLGDKVEKLIKEATEQCAGKACAKLVSNSHFGLEP